MSEQNQRVNQALSEELANKIQPISFSQLRSYGSGGVPVFCHWIESCTYLNKLVIPFSYSNLAVPGGIFVSDDGLNIREVYRSVTPNENYWLTARSCLGDGYVLVGSGSSGAFAVGSLYRSRINPELDVWTNIFPNIDARVYGLEVTRDGSAVLVGTSNAGAESATGGLLYRSTNINIAVPTFTLIATLTEGIRTIKTIGKTGTILIGTGHANGGGIYRSIDGGLTIALVHRFTAAQSRAVYWFHEEINGDIYASLVTTGQVWVSTDDGLTWSLAFTLTANTQNPSLPLIRRTVHLAGRVYAAVSHLGPCIMDFPNGQAYPIYSVENNINNYCLEKHRGGLVTTFSERIAYSGHVQTAYVPLWRSQAVADLVNGSATSHFSMLEHDRATVYIYSDQAGTLYIQGFDEVALAFRDSANIPIVATTLTSYVITANTRLTRLRFVPAVAATVNAWAVLS